MIAARVAKALPCLRSNTPRRAVLARAATPQSPDQTPEVEEAIDPTINPTTGNPQTGKLIDVYFEVGSFLVVVAVAFASLWNVKDVLNQTSAADSLREPASKSEWVAMDNQNVRFLSLSREQKMLQLPFDMPVPNSVTCAYTCVCDIAGLWPMWWFSRLSCCHGGSAGRQALRSS